MKVGLGPAKGKDFATSLGPVVVTPDEFDGSSAVMVARVNGEERSRGNLADLFHPWDRISSSRRPEHRALARATSSAPEPSGPAASRTRRRTLLQPGDEVELEVEDRHPQ